MGGEPTFVAVDDRDAAEWNTDALGPTKRGLATELVHRLRAKYGQGAFLHFGQGKWYPGEQLPRWALSICWRADGQPCWNDPSLFADERDAHQYTSADAQRFTHALTRRLGLDAGFVQPAFEDTWYYLWRERRLPVNVDPFDARLDDELERARLRRVFAQGLDQAVGYLLPLKREWQVGTAGPAWITGPWFLRDERLYLMPGDSPMGFACRSIHLPWAAAGDRPLALVQDPFAALTRAAGCGRAAPAGRRAGRAALGATSADESRRRSRRQPRRAAMPPARFARTAAPASRAWSARTNRSSRTPATRWPCRRALNPPAN
jgi:uncharacterized protein (DUF2126 family)